MKHLIIIGLLWLALVLPARAETYQTPDAFLHETFSGDVPQPAVLWLTGAVPSPSGKDPFCHILYLKNEKPDIYRKAYKFLEPKDYLNLRFTGRFCASYDSIAMHWVTNNRDINNVFYGKKLIKWSTIDPAKLPELKKAVEICGPIKAEIADELGLSRDVVEQFRASGEGWQTRIDGALKDWLKTHTPA